MRSVVCLIAIALMFAEPVLAGKRRKGRHGAADSTTAHYGTSISWQAINDADILWKKQVNRVIVIDDTSGGNRVLRSLIDSAGHIYSLDEIIIKAAKEHALTTYGGSDSPQIAIDTLIDLMPDKQQVEKYELKEEWVFDRKLGKMIVRLLWIGPCAENDKAMFYLKYRELRYVLSNYYVMPKGETNPIYVDEFFETRQFRSKISWISPRLDNNPEDVKEEWIPSKKTIR